MFGHFLNNIRALQIKASKTKHNVKLTTRAKEDLILSRSFLKLAHIGVSMNLVMFQKPDIFYIGDVSEHGLGGFADHGRAWRWEIPEDLQGRAHINLLEFITQVVCIWVDILEKRVNRHDCLLGIGDRIRICRSYVGLGVISYDLLPELVFWHIQNGWRFPPILRMRLTCISSFVFHHL
jgi:hypothetical protein